MRGINFVGVFMILLLGASLASANVLPCPITVKLIPPADLCEGSYKITIENLRTNAIVTGQTNQYFEYVYDWANFGSGGYLQGDIFRISVLGITQDIKYTGQPPTEFVDMNGNPVDFVNLNVGDYCPDGCIVTVTKTRTVTEYVDRIVKVETPVYVDKVVEVIKEVPVEVEKIIEKIERVEVPQECPDCIIENEEDNTTSYGIVALILLILALLGVNLKNGEGIKMVIRSRADTGKLEVQITQHKHYGISGYHDINTIHKKENIRHPAGEINPNYIDGVYVPSIPEEEE